MLATRAVPPGPRGYPLLGVFPKARHDPLAFFVDSARRYGDVVSMCFGPRRLYLLTHPDHVKHVLQDRAEAYGKRRPAARIRPLFGDSLTTVDGAHWRRQRRMIRPVFHPRSLGTAIPAIVDATSAMLERWQHVAARGDVLDVGREMTDVTRAIILRLLFGPVEASRAAALGEALDVALEHADQRLWSVVGWLDAAIAARPRAALRVVDEFVEAMVAQARRRSPSDTWLSMLANARDAATGAPMLDHELRDEVKALLVAGHTTTSSALTWTWYALSQHPPVCGTLRRALQGPDDVRGVGYLRRVIDEVLRLYPPTWVTARTALHDDAIGSYTIPAGALVLLSPFVTHRDPRFWEAPQRFDPERFTPERTERRPRFAYFPFGGGPRRCIGSSLATLVVQLVVGMVVRRFELTLVPGAHVAMRAGLTLRPAAGVPMTLRRCG